MNEYRYRADSEADTTKLGERLAAILPAGTVIALIGNLGAGKTRLVQAVAHALGNSTDSVSSPTFVLVNEYLEGRLPVYHFDTYRLKDEDEFIELGPSEYFEGAGLTFVEWADRVEACLPEDYLIVQIEILSETGRGFSVSASSSAGAPLLELLQSHE